MTIRTIGHQETQDIQAIGCATQDSHMFRVTKNVKTPNIIAFSARTLGLSRSDVRAVMEFSGRKAINTIIQHGLAWPNIYIGNLVILEVLLALLSPNSGSK